MPNIEYMPEFLWLSVITPGFAEEYRLHEDRNKWTRADKRKFARLEFAAEKLGAPIIPSRRPLL